MLKSVALFIPCYIDQLYPQVGVATVKLLNLFGIKVQFPENQICCGQPMANSGCFKDARHFANSFNDVFKEFEYIVCPSGSCTSMIRNHYNDILDEVPKESASHRIYELCEFLVDILKISPPKGHFPKRVGIHQACHGLRELKLGSQSELVGPYFNKLESLLKDIQGIEIVPLKRKDECCGFGGTFSVDEAGVSARMGDDRVKDHLNAGAEIITSADMSCLMHMEGILRRNGSPLKVLHIAELLYEATKNKGAT